jgi:hypothetical protein
LTPPARQPGIEKLVICTYFIKVHIYFSLICTHTGLVTRQLVLHMNYEIYTTSLTKRFRFLSQFYGCGFLATPCRTPIAMSMVGGSQTTKWQLSCPSISLHHKSNQPPFIFIVREFYGHGFLSRHHPTPMPHVHGIHTTPETLVIYNCTRTQSLPLI